MSAVDVQEVITALQGASLGVHVIEAERRKYLCKLSDRIEAHGIAPPDGWVLVPETEFNQLLFWLDRCDEKGHLDNCPDLVEPLEKFNQAMLAKAKGGDA